MLISVLKYLALSLLLCKCLCSVVAVNAGRTINRDKKPIKLTDLNADVLYTTLNNLDAFDLLHLSQINTMLHSVAATVFRHKYHHVEMSCQMHERMCRNENETIEKLHVNDDLKRLTITDFELSFNLLKYFGDSMKKISISRFINHIANTSTIYTHVNKYASDVTHLQLDGIDEILLSHFTAPFEQLEELDCSFMNEKNVATRPVNELFPNLRRLTVSMLSTLGPSFFVVEFPQLEHVEFKIASSSSEEYVDMVADFLRKNPQIQSIDYYIFPDDFIKVVHELLPNITSLTLYSLNNGHEILDFKNVRHLNVGSQHPTPIDQLSFEHLESLKIIYTSGSFNSFRRFFEMNHNLKRLDLSITSNGWTVYDQLETLLADLNDLVEVTLKLYHYAEADVIIRFVKKHTNLNKLDFIIWTSPESDMKIIQEQFKIDWHFQNSTKCPNVHWRGLAMERRSSMLLECDEIY